MKKEEQVARAAGWFPTREAHIVFRQADPEQVVRHLKAGEVYSDDEDSLISVPLKHASSWKEACERDNLEVKK